MSAQMSHLPSLRSPYPPISPCPPLSALLCPPLPSPLVSLCLQGEASVRPGVPCQHLSRGTHSAVWRDLISATPRHAKPRHVMPIGSFMYPSPLLRPCNGYPSRFAIWAQFATTDWRFSNGWNPTPTATVMNPMGTQPKRAHNYNPPPPPPLPTPLVITSLAEETQAGWLTV